MRQLPGYISGLTGIEQIDIQKAPEFKTIATQLYDLLKDKVLVAHNVNFDYSFLNQEFQLLGYKYAPQKLCTMRLSRKFFPEYKSYSLGNICGALGIDTQNRHRAMGDALAAFELLKRMHESVTSPEMAKLLQPKRDENKLPPNLPLEEFTKLPDAAGVYYFKDEHQKVIYVGKALNLRKRVTSHFTGNVNTPQRQGFLREIHHIDFVLTGNELIALLHESTEIRKYWPRYNRSQKKPESYYGIYRYTGEDGFDRLIIDQVTRYRNTPLIRFDSFLSAYEQLKSTTEVFQLCYLKTSLPSNGAADFGCTETCNCKKGVHRYNKLVQKAIHSFSNIQRSYLLLTPGRLNNEKGLVHVKNGQYAGYGFVSSDEFKPDNFESFIVPVKHNHTAIAVIEGYLLRNETACELVMLNS